MKNLFDIKDKVIVLTGGCGILGRNIANYRAEQGAKIVVLDRVEEAGRELEAELNQKSEALFLVTDVLNKEVLEENKKAILERFGTIDVLLNGDGNSNPAQALKVGTSPIGGTAGSLTYSELVDFWAQFDPYEMNTLLASGDVMLKLLKLTEFQNPLTGLNFQGTGKLATPLGAKLLRTAALDSGTLIGLDKHYALEMVQGSDVLVEYDKLIDRQLERAAITSISGFAKLYTDAAKVLRVG